MWTFSWMKKEPPDVLFHGTVDRVPSLDACLKGLKKEANGVTSICRKRHGNCPKSWCQARKAGNSECERRENALSGLQFLSLGQWRLVDGIGAHLISDVVVIDIILLPFSRNGRRSLEGRIFMIALGVRELPRENACALT